MDKPLVLLDPGHGGVDPGAVYNGLLEKDLNLELALKTATSLKEVRVLLTREVDSFVSLADRVEISRKAKPDLFLSLHANAGGGKGFESFISSRLTNADKAFKMQQAIHSEMMQRLKKWDVVDRGLKKASFYVLRLNPYPAVLIESLFIDNAREAELWTKEDFINSLVEGVCSGIYQALGIDGSVSVGDKASEQVKGKVVSLEGKKLYTVQVGAFLHLENARQRLTEAQRAGFSDAYIYRKQL